MLYLTAETKVLVVVQPVDFRRQMDGLIAVCQQKLQQDPRSGHLFVFINRAKTMIRVLCYEKYGYWLATKRLSRGRFSLWPNDATAMAECHADELTKILKTFVAPKRKTV